MSDCCRIWRISERLLSSRTFIVDYMHLLCWCSFYVFVLHEEVNLRNSQLVELQNVSLWHHD